MKAETWFTAIHNIKAGMDRGMIDKDQAAKLILAVESANKNPQPIKKEFYEVKKRG